MINYKDYWKQLSSNVFVIWAKGLEDFWSVMSAKISRSINIRYKLSSICENNIAKFLTQNLKQYGHASIADMCYPTIIYLGTGWITNWFLLDDPLFNGQELSTRVVQSNKLSIDSHTKHIHSFYYFWWLSEWTRILSINHVYFWYDHLPCWWILKQFLWFKCTIWSNKDDKSKAYKYDMTRWCMPGNTYSGVVMSFSSWSMMKLLLKLRRHSFLHLTINHILEGVKECAPYLYRSLYTWKYRLEVWWMHLNAIDHNRCWIVDIEAPINLKNRIKRIYQEHPSIPNRQFWTELDDIFDRLGTFKIKILCSIAAARDFHRHRSMMPWIIKLVLNHQRWAFIYPIYKIPILEYDLLIKYLSSIRIWNAKNQINYHDLYAYPFGATVLIEGQGTLKHLLYMLELWYYAKNAFIEYRFQAWLGLKWLINILPLEFIKWHCIKV